MRKHDRAGSEYLPYMVLCLLPPMTLVSYSMNHFFEIPFGRFYHFKKILHSLVSKFKTIGTYVFFKKDPKKFFDRVLLLSLLLLLLLLYPIDGQGIDCVRLKNIKFSKYGSVKN